MSTNLSLGLPSCPAIIIHFPSTDSYFLISPPISNISSSILSLQLTGLPNFLRNMVTTRKSLGKLPQPLDLATWTSSWSPQIKLLVVPSRSSALPIHKVPSFSLTPWRHNRDSLPPPPSPLSQHTKHSFVSLLGHSPLALNFSYLEKQNIDKTKQSPLSSTAVTASSSF